MRKIIQVIVNNEETMALCDDGTFWMWDAPIREWVEWSVPIPQSDEWKNTID